MQVLAKRVLDVRSGRWDTAVLISIACGLGIFATGLLLFTVQYNFSAYFGLNFSDAADNNPINIVQVLSSLGTVIISPILETIGVVFIYYLLIGLLKFHRAIFVLITTVGFALLHKHPINGGVIFLLLSLQYIFMRWYYSKRVAFWSIATSHGMNNALAVAATLFVGNI